MKLIDADALCKHLHELKTGDKDTVYEYYDDGIDTAISEAATFPTIEAEPVKHGRWEFEAKWQYKNCDGRGMERKEIFGTTKRTFNRLKCSRCKKAVVIDDTITYAYCPHCGAKMDKEETE